jgi:hypothetical protein
MRGTISVSRTTLVVSFVDAIPCPIRRLSSEEKYFRVSTFVTDIVCLFNGFLSTLHIRIMQHRVGSEVEDDFYLRQDSETFGHNLLHGIPSSLPETEVQQVKLSLFIPWGRNRFIAALILNLALPIFAPGLFNFRAKTLTPHWTGLQRWNGPCREDKNFLPLPTFESQIFQPVTYSLHHLRSPGSHEKTEEH